MNATPRIHLLCWATLAATATAACLVQQPRPALYGRVLAGDSTRRLAGAQLIFQPEEDHDVVLLRGWVGAGPRQQAHTDSRGRYRIPSARAGCLLVRHDDTGLGAIVHRAAPNSFQTVQTRPMGELLLPGGKGAVADVLALSPAGERTHLGPWPGPGIRLPEGRYRLLVGSGGRWTEFRCQVVSGRSQKLQAGEKVRSLRLFDGFRGRVTLLGWPRIALPIAAGEVQVPDGPGPRILQVWEQRQGCFLLRQTWIQHRTQTLAASARGLQRLVVQDAHGNPVAGAWCFSCYRDAGGLRIVSRSQSDAGGRAATADVTREPTGFVLVLKRGFALGHAEVFGAGNTANEAVKVTLQPGHRLAVLVLGPRGNPQPAVEVCLEPLAAPWATCRSFTGPKGEVLFKDLPLGEARARLLGTPFLTEAHPLRVTRTPGRVVIQARPGHEIRGRVLLPSGQPAANALVVVRDPRGSTAIGEKIACTGPDGRFTLAGLPAELPLVLTASLEHGGRTWTSKALRVQARTVGLRVQLLAEDRPPPGRGDGKDHDR